MKPLHELTEQDFQECQMSEKPSWEQLTRADMDAFFNAFFTDNPTPEQTAAGIAVIGKMSPPQQMSMSELQRIHEEIEEAENNDRFS